jgi:nitrite reductase/ring-hydroxylating ferredoxin subunit
LPSSTEREYVTVANLSEVLPGSVLAVQAGERWYALVNLDGVLHAVDNNCPHNGGPLSRGTLDGQTLTCPWHCWSWDVTTGRNRAPGVDWRLPRLPVRVLENGEIQLPII